MVGDRPERVDTWLAATGRYVELSITAESGCSTNRLKAVVALHSTKAAARRESLSEAVPKSPRLSNNVMGGSVYPIMHRRTATE